MAKVYVVSLSDAERLVLKQTMTDRVGSRELCRESLTNCAERRGPTNGLWQHLLQASARPKALMRHPWAVCTRLTTLSASPGQR